MLREAAEDEIRKIGSPLWLLVNNSGWPDDIGTFSASRIGAASILAHLAYCAIDDKEREKRNRAKVIPCQLFQQLLSAEYDFKTILNGMDFTDTEIVRTKSYVAVILPARNVLLIGVRGTQFAYDWLINARATKTVSHNNVCFHTGFLKEAQDLARAIELRLRSAYRERLQRPDCAIYLSGHSLGGAISAILSEMTFSVPINETYMFGAPRVSDTQCFSGLSQPIGIRRYLDIVPHCPPQILGFGNFMIERATDGGQFVPENRLETFFFLQWLIGMSFRSFPTHHSMERYRGEVLQIAKQDKENERFWRENWI